MVLKEVLRETKTVIMTLSGRQVLLKSKSLGEYEMEFTLGTFLEHLFFLISQTYILLPINVCLKIYKITEVIKLHFSSEKIMDFLRKFEYAMKNVRLGQ